MNQHESRKVAMQAIFLANQDRELSAPEVEVKVVETLDLNQLPAYSKTLIDGVLFKREELEEDISSHLKKGWRLERVNAIVVAILEIALYEIKYSADIEPKAAVNEALNLCDEFTDPSAKPFVNGILGNFVEK
ncbi:transcription antitermination factor NusB [Lactobacillus kalixensis]|uniref:Transcription antitermination factor NusB n=1 Tax=Lactobacillus kalixensis DSM 16043 TaxID=1423763 RepID=A0A0R1UEL1_9LACO|nr:transcription antitermination factor NusB [Lactobacillus kalixensis]KRL89674.1 transcription antitermination factor NusB [Lactobacillus kalixensis DSM 16043]